MCASMPDNVVSKDVMDTVPSATELSSIQLYLGSCEVLNLYCDRDEVTWKVCRKYYVATCPDVGETMAMAGSPTLSSLWLGANCATSTGLLAVK